VSDTTRPDDLTTARAAHGIRGSDTTTRGIRVQVRSTYLADRSSPKEAQYLFQYHVRISNVGNETAQLVSREWVITNADGEVERVKGPGVVGEQPVLAPGSSFEYASFCPLKTAVGSMHGSYQMVTESGEQFDAIIAPFTLAVPNALN
jgi:ApaG protein